MTNQSMGLSDALREYMLRVGVREPQVLRRLRARTMELPEHNMQIAPEQGAFMSLLVQLIGARNCIEVGAFTGYSALAVALALPADGRLTCCDISEEWTDIGKPFWAEAGVADRINLRIGSALDTLDSLLDDGGQDSFDFAFVDADKVSYSAYYERLFALVRTGGVMLFDNVFWGGAVLDVDSDDPDAKGIQQVNATLAADERIDLVMLPLADGLTVVRKK